MAFDGITIRALVNELKAKLCGGRLSKIAQPERDELFITVKTAGGQQRLLVSANAGLPLVYLTEASKPSPPDAPGFCMLLRKHIGNGRITDISQPGLERVIDFTIEHLDEMGDLCVKHLIVELMGKHSNIIFTDSGRRIIDSIKRINASVSSVREVLPGREYFIPDSAHKLNPLDACAEEFKAVVCALALPLSRAVYTSYTGISPQAAENICRTAGLDSDISASELSENEGLHLAKIFINTMDDVSEGNFSPCIISEAGKPVDFCVLEQSLYPSCALTPCESVSRMLEDFYAAKSGISLIRRHSADLRQIVSTALERNYKKLDLQASQLKDTDKRGKYRIYGELINAYAYEIPDGASSFEALNYYDGTAVTIPLDRDLSAIENSRRYFARYGKLKRTYEALSGLVVETKNEIDYLESVAASLDIASSYDDLVQIKEELVSAGFIKSRPSAGKKRPECSKSKPLHYISSDGFHIYVGKNNIQNEELTFKFASGNDWWFHAKSIPGSHVIVKTDGRELPDSTFEQAAALAAYYSVGRAQEKVEIDYVERKFVKKVNGGAPGFVIYHTNYSMNIAPDISGAVPAPTA
ncbi:MAG: NFACT family protein [Butyrivibrio sp.]|nr:NFACT family protein [Butyrivibrio sp.]